MPEAPVATPVLQAVQTPPVDSPEPQVEPEAQPEATPPPVVPAGVVLPIPDSEFQRRVDIVSAAIEDPIKMRRAIAEIHTYLSMFEEGFREMQNEMASGGGPFALIRKMLFSKGGPTE